MEVLYHVISLVPAWVPLSAIVGMTALWWSLTKRHHHWEDVGIPYVKPVPLLGSMGALFSNLSHEVEVKRYKENGRVYGTYEGSKPNLIVGDPDILRNILVKDFQFFTDHRNLKLGDRVMDNILPNLMGEDWKRVRALITPAFSTGKIKRMTSIFLDSAEALTENFKAAARNEKPLDVKRLFGTFTMDVLISAAFGAKIDSHNDPENLFVRAARNLFNKNIPWRFILYFLCPRLMSFFKIGIYSPHTFDFFEEVVLNIIKERKRSGQKRNDFLQLMIDAAEGKTDKETEIQDQGEERHDQIFKSNCSTKTLSKDEMIAQCIVFFLGGYDTTSSVLAFTAYELALNPDVQNRLISEIDEIVKLKGKLSYGAISEMEYLDSVFSESLRKYPPGVRAERMATADYVIKEKNIAVPKDMVVQVPIYAIHHDPLHYPEPEKFDPHRFSAEQKAARHPFAFLPFGAGPRNCVASRFALVEIKTCLAHVLSHCRFVTCSETQVPLEFYLGQLVLQPKQVMLKIEMRKDRKE